MAEKTNDCRNATHNQERQVYNTFFDAISSQKYHTYILLIQSVFTQILHLDIFSDHPGLMHEKCHTASAAGHCFHLLHFFFSSAAIFLCGQCEKQGCPITYLKTTSINRIRARKRMIGPLFRFSLFFNARIEELKSSV